MQKKIMVAAIVAVTALVLAMPVAAQTSNTNKSTAGIFSNDVDLFTHYHKYGNVLSDGAKWFGFVTGDTSNGGSASLGYATNFGGIYLGAWYNGYIVKLTNADYFRQTITPVYNSLDVLTQTEDKTEYLAEKTLTSYNDFKFLIGVAGQGIKVGFKESYSTDLNPAAANRALTVTDYKDGRVDYGNAVVAYKNESGTITPSLGWGTNLAISGMNLMPYVDLGFSIYNEQKVDNYENYITVNGEKQLDPATNGTVGAGKNNGKMTPDITVGARIDLPKKGTVVNQFGLKYNINFELYSNSYDGTGLTGDPVAGTVSWSQGSVNRVTNYADRTQTATNLTLTINEKTQLKNTITPSYKITGEPFENFKIGFSAGIPVSFDFITNNGYDRQIQRTEVKYLGGVQQGYVTETETFNYNGTHNDQSTLNLQLDLAFGAQYKLVPNRLTLNAGIKATPFGYSYTNTKTIPNSVTSVATSKTTMEDGSVTANTKTVGFSSNAQDSVRVQDSWSAWTANLGGGFVFNFSPNAALDLGANQGFTSTGFTLDATNVNVIFTFKF